MFEALILIGAVATTYFFVKSQNQPGAGPQVASLLNFTPFSFATGESANIKILVPTGPLPSSVVQQILSQWGLSATGPGTVISSGLQIPGATTAKADLWQVPVTSTQAVTFSPQSELTAILTGGVVPGTVSQMTTGLSPDKALAAILLASAALPTQVTAIGLPVGKA